MVEQFKIAEIQLCICGKLPGFRKGVTTLKKWKRLECECGRATKWFEADDVFPGYEDDYVSDVDLIDAWNEGLVYTKCENCGHHTQIKGVKHGKN